MARHTPTYPAAFWRLTGPLAGKTFRASAEFLFVDGVFSSRRFSPADLPRMDRHFEQWQAVRFDPAKEGQPNGERNTSPEGERQADSDLLTDGGQPSAGEKADVGHAGDNASPVEGGGRLVPEGDGQTESVGVTLEAQLPADPFNARMVRAIMSLDPKVDSQWTQAGKPALDAVEAALGHAGVKRADVEAACPGYVRPSRVLPPDGTVQEA